MSENIGLITLVCSWTFTVIATLATGLSIRAPIPKQRSFRLEDCIQIAAYLVTVVLVAQITWAIVDESQDKHVTEIPRSQLVLIANV